MGEEQVPGVRCLATRARDWGLGAGDWRLGAGDWGLGTGGWVLGQTHRRHATKRSVAADTDGEFPQFFMAASEQFVGGEFLEILEA